MNDRSKPLNRAVLEARWLDLTRRVLPGLAVERGWPVRDDHCFQRMLLDNAFGGVWYDHVARRPAYAQAEAAALARAVALGEAAVAGDADLGDLDRRSLAWRRSRPSKRVRAQPISASGLRPGTKLERIA